MQQYRQAEMEFNDMRTWMLAALTLLAVGLIDARPASAAWTCVGAEYVCGPAPNASAAASSRSAYSDEQRPTRKRSHAKAKAKATTSASWNDETQAEIGRAHV
jgi:hypothetical protein